MKRKKRNISEDWEGSSKIWKGIKKKDLSCTLNMTERWFLNDDFKVNEFVLWDKNVNENIKKKAKPYNL